jgi:predicted NAD/FAD-binding protein
MAERHAGIQVNALALLGRATEAHRAVMQGIATHAQKQHVKRLAELDAMRERAELSTPLKAPSETP